jgi:hypothetical protein
MTNMPGDYRTFYFEQEKNIARFVAKSLIIALTLGNDQIGSRKAP